MKMTKALWSRMLTLFASDPANLANMDDDTVTMASIAADFNQLVVTNISELTIGTGVILNASALFQASAAAKIDPDNADGIVYAATDGEGFYVYSTGSTFPKSCYGYVVYDQNDGRILATEKFDAPVVFTEAGQIFLLKQPHFRFPREMLK